MTHHPTPYIYSRAGRLLLVLGLAAGLAGCFERELEREDNYQNVKQAPSIADNEVLRFRSFKIEGHDRFLIFGTSNEVSLEGSAQLPCLLSVDGRNHAATIDLAGSIYSEPTGQPALRRGAPTHQCPPRACGRRRHLPPTPRGDRGCSRPLYPPTAGAQPTLGRPADGRAARPLAGA